MKCITTCAVMRESDTEFVVARQRLAARLMEIKADCDRSGAGGSETAAVWTGDEWRYLCSTPHRNDSGAICYIHIFEHQGLVPGGKKLALAIVASARWWPVGCASPALPRTPRRGALRLVS